MRNVDNEASPFWFWVLLMAGVVVVGTVGGYVAGGILQLAAALWEPLPSIMGVLAAILFFAWIFWFTDSGRIK